VAVPPSRSAVRPSRALEGAVWPVPQRPERLALELRFAPKLEGRTRRLVSQLPTNIVLGLHRISSLFLLGTFGIPSELAFFKIRWPPRKA